MAKVRLALRKQDGRLVSEGRTKGEHWGRTGIRWGRTPGTGQGKAGEAHDRINVEKYRLLPDTPADPLKPAIQPTPPKGWLARLIRNLITRRELSDEQRSMLAEKQLRKKLEAQLRDEADLFMARIISALNIRGLCYRYPKSERDMMSSGVKSIAFSTVVMQPEAIYLKIDTVHRPRGVGILQLMDPDILTDLSLTCGHKVTGEYREEIGAWYIVERATGVRGIPVHVKYQEMLETWPQSADELTIPLGMSTNSKRIYRSLKDFPHLLIAGATDSGKSNMMNVIIGTLISRNHPYNLKMLMVDLKGGMEMTFYEGIPHLLTIPKITETGIIYEREQVPDALQWLIHEGERRMELIKKAGHKGIAKYNANRKHNRLPRIVLVIDEFADVKLAPKIGSLAEDRLANLCSRMRAVGIHVIVATQVPKKEVISTIVKTNLPAKMCFSVPTYTASELVLDNGHAKGLAPQGRLVWQKGEQLTIQAPYMPDGLIREIVQSVLEGKKVNIRTTHDVTLDEVLEFALDQLGGELAYKRIHEYFKVRGLTQKEAHQWVMQLEGQTITIRENVYEVTTPAGSAPRKLKLVKEAELSEIPENLQDVDDN